MRTDIKEAYLKCIKVIKSCTTDEHLSMAKKYVYMFYDMYEFVDNNDRHSLYNIEACDRYNELRHLLEEKAVEIEKAKYRPQFIVIDDYETFDALEDKFYDSDYHTMKYIVDIVNMAYANKDSVDYEVFSKLYDTMNNNFQCLRYGMVRYIFKEKELLNPVREMHDIVYDYKKYHGKRVKTCDSVGTLIGIGADFADYYYLVKNDNGVIKWNTCVGGIELIGK